MLTRQKIIGNFNTHGGKELEGKTMLLILFRSQIK